MMNTSEEINKAKAFLIIGANITETKSRGESSSQIRYQLV